MDRVLFYGNKGNAGLRLATWVRQEGIDARLLVPREIRSDRSRPEWQDPSLGEGLPPWIERYRRLKYVHWLVPPRKARSMARRASVVVTTGRLIVGALALDAPVVFFPMGGELTYFPFQRDLLHYPVSLLYRRRISRVSRIVSAQENIRQAAVRLGVGDRWVWYPLPVDVEGIRDLVDRDLLERLERRYGSHDAVFLLPSRKAMDPNDPNYKAPEKCAVALRRFLDDEGADADVRVVVGLHGPHAARFRELLGELDLEEACDFVGHLPRPELHAYFSLSNAVVFDQFGDISRYNLSGAAREALSLGAVVVAATEVESDAFRSSHGADCPLLFAGDVDEIRERMRVVAGWSSQRFARYGEEARAWTEEHMDWRSRIGEFIEILRDAAETGRG